MSELKVRKIDFVFDDDIPFQWNPQNPYWGNFVNFITLIAPAFERYFIKATRLAMPDIKDEMVKKDADLFCLQEAQHSRHHIAHLKLLCRKYPGLAETQHQIMDSYEQLFKSESMGFHLSYAATVELCFGPTAKFLINHRRPLFRGSDSRIASFIMWHLVEEFEHRNSAIDIYNDVVGSYWYRMRTAPKVVKHLWQVYDIAVAGLEQHVPNEVCGGIGPADTSQVFAKIPITAKLHYGYELACTLLPLHRPDNVKQPQWVTDWFAAEEAGEDMRCYYSEPA